jgi:Family of unknown function (DUF6350)
MSDRDLGDVDEAVGDPPPTGAFETVIAEAPAEPLLEASIVASRAARREERSTPLGATLAGWDVALLWSAVAAAAALAVAEAVTWLGAVAGHSHASTATVLRTGGAVFLWFHGVGITLSPPAGGFGGPGAAILQNVAATLSFTFMTGTLLVVILLARGGRRVAAAVGGPGWLRGLHGAKIALPYGVLCLLVSLLERFTLHLPGSSFPGVDATGVLVHPAYLQALLWPLLLGIVAGFIGGLRSTPETDRATSTRLLRGAVSGAVAMLAFALALSFLGLLILAALHPDATRAYLDGMFRAGTSRGLALLALNLLALPNLCVWLLVPAMGSCVAGHVSYGGASYSSCLISYGHVATRAALRGVETLGPFATDPRQLPRPNSGYLGMMGIPLLAALLGGYVAGRTATSPTRSAASGAGVLAGAGFGLLVAAASLLAALILQVHGVPGLEGGGRPVGTATLWLGPAPLQGGLFALAWGFLGGSLGGLLAGPSGDFQTIRVDTGFG